MQRSSTGLGLANLQISKNSIWVTCLFFLIRILPTIHLRVKQTQTCTKAVPPSGIGHGSGSGKPFPSSSDPFVADNASAAAPASRDRGVPGPSQQRMPLQQPQPMFFVEGEKSSDSQTKASADSSLPPTILSVLSSAGRGKPTVTPPVSEKPKEENRHLRARKTPQVESSKPPSLRLSREEAQQLASMGILLIMAILGSQIGFVSPM
nr:translation initiation factor IF-2-like [Ipomoea batatas]